MVAIIKNSFRLQNAKEFLKNFSVSVTDKNFYLFVGKPLPWRAPEGQSGTSTISSSNADLYPPLPEDTLSGEGQIWDEMLGLKKISPNDVSLVIPRSDWKPRTIFAVFDDSDAHLYQRPTLEDVQKARSSTTSAEIADPALGYRKAGNFYALNSLNELFVCLSNNGGGISTVEPTRSGDPTNLVVSPGDNYVWKYITTITSGDAVKFLTDVWIPVKTITVDNGTGQKQVQDAAKSGEVLGVIVTNTQNSDETPAIFPNIYEGLITILLSENNPGKEATVVTNAIEDQNAYAGYQLHITNTTTGTNYIFNVTSYVVDELSGQNRLLIDGNFVTSGFAVGQQYTAKILPKLTVYSNGTISPIVAPVVDSGSKQIKSVVVTNSGENATFVSIEVERPVVGTPGTSVLPKIRAIVSPLSGLGKNPEKDLGAFYVMVSSQIRYDEGADQDSPTSQPNLADFPVKNDYRQIGILQNARKNDGSVTPPLCTENTLRATKRIRVQFFSESTLGITGDPGFKSDEELDLRDASGNSIGKLKAIDFKFFNRDTETDAYVGEITFVQTPDTKYTIPAVTNQVFGLTTGALAQVIQVHDEELKKFEGEILYIENRRPVLRSVDQIEDIKTIIEF